MTTFLHRRGTLVVAAILLATALSILSVATARADPLARPGAVTAAASGPVSPAAGTDGRGGVAPLAVAGTSAAAAAAGGSQRVATTLAARGRVPAPLPPAPANAGWIIAGITAATLAVGAALWWALTRSERVAVEPASATGIGPRVVESSDDVSQEWERRKAA